RRASLTRPSVQSTRHEMLLASCSRILPDGIAAAMAPAISGSNPRDTSSAGQAVRLLANGRFAGQECPYSGLRAECIEVAVSATREADQALGLIGKLVKPLAQREGNHPVAGAVQDQHRGMHFADALVGAELVFHQQPYRQIPVHAGTDVGGRG